MDYLAAGASTTWRTAEAAARCVDRPWLNRYCFSSAPLDLWVSASNVYSPVLQILVMPLLSDLANTACFFGECIIMVWV